MENDYQLRRHTELYESQNRQVKRIILFGIVFAYIVLVNILKPYAARVATLQKDLKDGNAEIVQVAQDKKALDELQRTFVSVQNVIAASPWDSDKKDLIREYREMNNSGRALSMDNYQVKADETVEKIGKMVLDSVSKPFQQFLGNGFIADKRPSLYTKLKNLPEVVARWTNENMGQFWYQTIDAKNEAVGGLTAALDYKLIEISGELSYADQMVQEQQRQLANKIDALQQKIDQEAKSLPEKLDAEMMKILPNWIGGIITFEQIMLYPFIIMGIVLYAMVLAFSLSRHYHFMIRGLKIPVDIKGDAALSSLWTLTDRGRLGTFLTLFCYMGFLVFMWYFYEQGYVLFRDSAPADTGQFFGDTMVTIGLWAGRVLFFMLLLLFIWRPFFKQPYRAFFWE
jgi:hypothetical protein